MKSIYKFTFGFLAVAAAAGFSACQDDIDAPAVASEAPVATMKPNTTILEVKQKYWTDATISCNQIGTKENGEHIIIRGRVISSDYSGNIYKGLYIQDETAALPLSINQYNLYLTYRQGQEVVIDLTEMYMGRYSGLEQLGWPQWSEKDQTYQPTFMQPATFDNHVELNGLPEPEKIDTILVSSMAEMQAAATDADYLMKMQGQIVRFNNVKFVDTAGIGVLGIYHENVNQTIEDADGNQLTVRTSGYSNFWNTELPTERGDVVGILGYYYSSSDPATSWQLTLIDKEGMMNFGNPTYPLGSEERPYSVAEAVAAETAGASASGWVEGYIVGTVGPEVETISSASDIEWGADATLATSVVIGQSAASRSLDECLVVPLPQNSTMRNYVALKSHPENLGKKLTVNGNMAKYMGTFGVTGCPGTSADFRLEGVEIPVEVKGTKENPYDVGDIIKLNPQSTTEAVESGVWVKGYIVGTYYDYNPHFDLSNPSNNNILLAATPTAATQAEIIDVQLPIGAVRTALNLKDNPSLLGKEVMVYGDVMKYNTCPGIKNTSDYVNDNQGGGTTTGGEALSALSENFDAATAIPSGWTELTVEGNKKWYVTTYSNNNYAAMTGYKGTAPFDSWLISPAVDLSKVSAKTLSFVSQVNGYGSTTSNIEVYVMTSADPTTATKTLLPATWATAPASGYSSWANSGTLNLSAFSGVVYIGFRYTATQDANYATWCIDNVNLPAK